MRSKFRPADNTWLALSGSLYVLGSTVLGHFNPLIFLRARD